METSKLFTLPKGNYLVGGADYIIDGNSPGIKGIDKWELLLSKSNHLTTSGIYDLDGTKVYFISCERNIGGPQQNPRGFYESINSDSEVKSLGLGEWVNVLFIEESEAKKLPNYLDTNSGIKVMNERVSYKNDQELTLTNYDLDHENKKYVSIIKSNSFDLRIECDIFI